MSCCKEMIGYRFWANQGYYTDSGWSGVSVVEHVPTSGNVGEGDARHLQQIERTLQRTDVARASLVHSWLVVRKRLMKKPKINAGPYEAFRKEAVKVYLKKKRMKRSGAETMEEGGFGPEPMDESPF